MDKEMNEYEGLFQYLEYIYRQTKCLTSYGYVCYYKDYIEIAKNIPKDKIIVDVGCGFGLQQLLFKDHRKYYGIQKFREGYNCNAGYEPSLTRVTENAELFSGAFKDIWQKTGITEENKDQYFGIANHSLWHDLSANKEDMDIFKRLFPNNYYATDESNIKIKY